MEENGGSLVELMGTVLERRDQMMDIPKEIGNIVKRVERFEGLLAIIATASTNLSHKCSVLSHKVSEVREIYSSFSFPPISPEKEYSFVLVSPPMKRVMLFQPFTLSFRLIDRDGASASPDLNEVFRLTANEEIVKMRRVKRRRECTEEVMVGQTVANAMVTGDICFKNVCFSQPSRVSPIGRYVLSIECVNNPHIHPLQVDPITVRTVVKKRKTEKSSDLLRSLNEL